jgi:hypothetical protein
MWHELFRVETIQVAGPLIVTPDGHQRIVVDIGALDPGQQQRLALKFARGWRLPSEKVLREFQTKGTVVLGVEGVTVTEDAARLF